MPSKYFRSPYRLVGSAADPPVKTRDELTPNVFIFCLGLLHHAKKENIRGVVCGDSISRTPMFMHIVCYSRVLVIWFVIWFYFVKSI